MKFTLSWLKTHLATDASIDRIADTLTTIGLELESIDDPTDRLAPFKIGQVIEARRHPNADRLQLCLVDTGDGEPVQVVCGAPNARTGMKGVFAPTGSHIPGVGLDLKAGKIRGEESNGMLCSEREMGLSDEHDGIIDLPEDAPIGEPFARYMGLDDPAIDVAVTPNRGDCLGVRGIARDLAAAGLGTLKPLDLPRIEGSYESPIGLRRDLPADKQAACPAFVGRHFRGVKNGPSPKWLQNRLTAIGLRPISALVDITNYVSLDLCRPLHVFDAAKLDRGVVVRMGEPGERLLALDGKEYALDDEICAICDESRVNGLGGAMGGAESGCTDGTTEVFLEVALFDPVRTAATGRKLNILSDARYRFERGVDPAFLHDGLDIATRLILDLCGGECSKPLSVGAPPEWRRSYHLRFDRVKTLIGIDVPKDEQKRILESLEFKLSPDEDGFSIAPPSWRWDIVGEAGLAAEIARIHGYDRLRSKPLPRETRGAPQPAMNPRQRRLSDIRRLLASRGMNECVTFSFMSSRRSHLFGGGGADLVLLNPIGADLDAMRPSLLPNLADVARRNADRGFGDLALFEIGSDFSNAGMDGQRSVAAGLRCGRSGDRSWAQSARAVDVFDVKADILAVLNACGAPVQNLRTTADAPDFYHPGRSGCLRLGPTALARFGALHPRILKALDLKLPTAAFEIFPDAIPRPKAKGGKTRPALRLAALQPVSRDFAFVVADDVPAEMLARAAHGADKDLIADVNVFDLFTGDNVAEGCKSLAIAVTLQPREATLTEDRIEAVSAKIVANVEKRTGGALRG